MSQRLRGFDVRNSDFPESVGLCASDNVGVWNYLNSAQRRLLYCGEAGNEGWFGGWAETAFTVSQSSPYVTFDRSVARMEYADLCDRPITVNNQFREYLRFGSGRMPKVFASQRQGCVLTESYARNNSSTFVDLIPGQLIRIYITNAADVGKRMLVGGTDNNGNVIYSQDGFNEVSGLFAVFQSPFTQLSTAYNTITGIQKDQTVGQVLVYGVDSTTGVQTLLLTMQPSETTASYRRYLMWPLPFSCCSGSNVNPCLQNPISPGVAVTAIVKLDFIPVQTDTDYCLIQNLEALKFEAMAYRYSKMDSPQSKQLEQVNHKSAVRMLQGEINHFEGITQPSINLAVFGDAHLERQRIGSLL